MRDPYQPVESVGVRVAGPMLSGPKRQHYLPKFYLDGFCKDGKLAVYDREFDEVRVQQPLNTGVIGHFYTFEDSEGRKRFELERMLSDFESKASPGIRKLAAREDLSADERADLSIFVALAGFRTPDIVESIKLWHSSLVDDFAKGLFADVEQVKERMRGHATAPASAIELDQQAKEMVEFVRSGAYKVTTSHRWAIGMAIMMALEIAPVLAGRNWLVVHRRSEKWSFVTSDAPVVLSTLQPRERSIWGVGFGNADAVVVFPLTQACALVIYGRDGTLRHGEIDSATMRCLNLAVSSGCQRYVVGRDRILLRSIADRLNLASKKWVPKLQWQKRVAT
ncbi:MAG: DUF4238 domain-containing protein [Dokdonella sp.]|uniref:DUF4238 domain-containing protein n=1 Tax=Dokdonella sp. TaxID=2291710 RepID=UPI003F7F1857